MGAGEDADAAIDAFGRMASVLERFPRELEEQALLRVEDARFTRRHAEELRVEVLDAFEHAARRDIVGQTTMCRGELVLREVADRLDTVDEVLPERVEVTRTRIARRHADDGDRLLSCALFLRRRCRVRR